MKISVRKIARLTGHNASVFALCAGAAEQEFLSAAGDGWVVRWDLEAPEIGRLVAKVETQIFSLAYFPDRSVVVAGNMNGGVHWVDLEHPELTRNIAHHQKGVFGLQRVGNSVFSIGGEGVITRWNLDDFRSVESLQLANQSLRSLDYHPGRRELAVGASDHSIYLLDAQTLSIKAHLPHAHENSVFSVRYAPDGSHLLSGGRDAHLKLWNLENRKLIASLPAHWFTINDIVFHPRGKWFATASRDKTVKIWDMESFQLLKVMEGKRDEGHLNSVNSLIWSAHQDQLISAGDDRSLIIWNISEE